MPTDREIGRLVSREPLQVKNAENLALYSPEEEMQLLHKIAQKMGMEVIVKPIRADGLSLGYAIFPQSKSRQQAIIAEAPWVIMDFDDTEAMTSLKKYQCWEELVDSGVPMELVQVCDQLARVSFHKEHGKIYEPELDMRLLTRARDWQQSTQSIEAVIQDLEQYRLQMLTAYESMTQLLAAEPVAADIREIFEKNRFQVELYPDSEEISRQMRGAEDAPKANIFGGTFGDAVFQFEKVLPLLKKGQWQAVFLTKAKKGPFWEAVIEQNPFQDLALSYRYKPAPREGISPALNLNPILVMDDDPRQVKSLQNLAQRLGIPVLALLRHRSQEHKRHQLETPEGEQVYELTRGENGEVLDNIEQIRDEIYAQAIERMILTRFEQWLDAIERLLEEKGLSPTEIKTKITKNPNGTINDFLRDLVGEQGGQQVLEHYDSITFFRRLPGSKQSLIQVREEIKQKAKLTLDKKYSLSKQAAGN